MSGSGLSGLEESADCMDLMQAMIEEISARLVIDDRGLILHQYTRRMVSGTFGQKWVQQMATEGKVIRVHWDQLDRRTQVELQEAHFDREDYRYVRTAATSRSRRLVAHDPDYSARVRRILHRRLSVDVCGAPAACTFVRLRLGR